MQTWEVTWFDGSRIRKTAITADIYNIASYASGAGVNIYAILKIEQVAS